MLDAHKAEVKRALKALRVEGTSRAFYCAQTDDGPVLHVTFKKVSAKRFATLSGLNKQYKKYPDASAFVDGTPFIAGKVTSAEGLLVFVPKVKKNGMAPATLTRSLRALRRSLKLPAFQVADAVALGSASGDTAKAAAGAASELQARLDRADRCTDAQWAALREDIAAFVPMTSAQTAKKLRAAVSAEKARRVHAAMLSTVRAQQPYIPTMDDQQLASLERDIQAYQKAGGAEDVSGIAQIVHDERALRAQELHFAAVLHDLSVPDMTAPELDALEKQIKDYNAHSGVMDLSELEGQISDERLLRADALSVMSDKVAQDTALGRSLRSRLQVLLGGAIGTAERKTMATLLAELQTVKAGLEGYREDVLLLV